MTLAEKINNDLKEAMKNKDSFKLGVIRMVKGAMQLEKPNPREELTDDDVIKVISKQIKMRKESIAQFEAANRNDLVEQNKKEIAILEEYMPEQLSEEELNKIIDKVFLEVKPTSMKDMGNIMKAIKRAAGSRNFWDIYPYLKRETRGYVPAFVGVMYAMTYYREYGIEPQDVGMPAAVDTFMIDRKLHFAQINEVVGVPMDIVKHLNPQYIYEVIPGTASRKYALKLPYNWCGPFMDAHPDSLYGHRAAELFESDVIKAASSGKSTRPDNRIVYKVKEGDYLGRIASRHHVTVKQLKSWNNLKSDKLRVGQILYIYK